MIKVSEVYEDLKATTKEVVDVFSLNGTRLDPSLIVGIANMVCLLRYMEKNKISEAAQEALIKLTKGQVIEEPRGGDGSNDHD
jgi:hypothetical protein